MMKDLISQVQFWNWNTRQFDDLGTEFSYENHVMQDYHLENNQLYMQDVYNSGDNRYWATVVEAEGDLILRSGFRYVNRMGYVVYKSEIDIDIYEEI